MKRAATRDQKRPTVAARLLEQWRRGETWPQERDLIYEMLARRQKQVATERDRRELEGD